MTRYFTLQVLFSSITSYNAVCECRHGNIGIKFSHAEVDIDCDVKPETA